MSINTNFFGKIYKEYKITESNFKNLINIQQVDGLLSHTKKKKAHFVNVLIDPLLISQSFLSFVPHKTPANGLGPVENPDTLHR